MCVCVVTMVPGLGQTHSNRQGGQRLVQEHDSRHAACRRAEGCHRRNGVRTYTVNGPLQLQHREWPIATAAAAASPQCGGSGRQSTASCAPHCPKYTQDCLTPRTHSPRAYSRLFCTRDLTLTSAPARLRSPQDTVRRHRRRVCGQRTAWRVLRRPGTHGTVRGRLPGDGKCLVCVVE